MLNISATIITFNEERNILRCIESLFSVADEIIVVDSFSTDQTKDICLAAGVRFEQHAFEGHIQQKNYALSLTSYPMVLSLDADEELSDQLKKSIMEVKNSLGGDFYEMNRLTNYCGKWVRYSGWYPDRKLRLFNKLKGSWDGLNPHDYFKPHDSSAKVIRLEGDLLHYSYYTRHDHYKQIELFSSIAAKAYFERKKKHGYIIQWTSPIAKFVKHFIIKLGFLDGTTGFHISRISAYATWLKYKKLNSMYKSENTFK